MSTAYIFPGQGSQAPGMGRALHQQSANARKRFAQANDILGFDITQIMFEGTADDLLKTSVTQPAIFLHSVILAEELGVAALASMVAGHSLGEFSALTAAGALTFEDGLRLVARRADAMQKACDHTPSTMAAIVGLNDDDVEAICSVIADVVVPANYNAPGQLVISGSIEAVEQAIAVAKTRGAKLARRLPVNGAFHSPLMEPARTELAEAILATELLQPRCPVYQNVTAKPEINPQEIQLNLVYQLTAPVRWTQSVRQMVADGATSFIEVGPGKVLQGLVKRIAANVAAQSIEAPAAP